MLCYCKKCGRMVQEVYGKEKQVCDYCGNNLCFVPDSFLSGRGKSIFNDEFKQQFIDEYVKSSPEFDQYLFDHREEDLFNRRIQNMASLEHGKAATEGRDKGNKFGIECPYCHATNVSKITVASKAVHTALFGLFAVGRNSKNYHCDHCGSDF